MNTNKNKLTRITVKLLPQGDIPNANGILYSTTVLKSLVDDFNKNKAPMLSTMNDCNINNKNIHDISHIVNQIFIDDDGKMSADISVLDSPNGKILFELLNTDSTFGVATMSTLSNSTDADNIRIAKDSTVANISLLNTT